jgi:pimeloyl-ACP methyl ester carboxylesterase
MTKLAYHRSGQGAPLVLAHGFPLDRTFWNPLLPHLEAQFDCIVPDLRGFGDSPASASGYSLEDMAADLSDLLARLGLPAAFLAGHSMGGYLAMAFARRFGAQLLGLGLLGTQAAADPPERKAGRYDTLAQVEREGLSAILGMAEKLTADPRHAPALRQIIQRQNPAGVMGALRAMAERPDSLSTLSALTIPVVIVHGIQDTLVSIERAREIKAALPSALLTELPGVGHSPPFEAPAETAAALKQLL